MKPVRPVGPIQADPEDAASVRGAEPVDWPAVLARPGPAQDEALRRLHELMVKAARHQVWRMRGMLHGQSPAFLDDLANSAADEALMVLLSKVSTFEGRSRFTTWAYKFAILQAATEVRRQAWTGREVRLEQTELVADPVASPEQQAEADDLAAAVVGAMSTALTPYQRKIAVALLIDEVPIDVLADRLGTTRGALYKALHQARGRLRASLRASGHLADDTPGATR